MFQQQSLDLWTENVSPSEEVQSPTRLLIFFVVVILGKKYSSRKCNLGHDDNQLYLLGFRCSRIMPAVHSPAPLHPYHLWCSPTNSASDAVFMLAITSKPGTFCLASLLFVSRRDSRLITQILTCRMTQMALSCQFRDDP